MKYPIAIISNDWHLKEDNIQQVMNLMYQKVELARETGCRKLCILGDVFHSRKGQSQQVLNAFRNIIKDILTCDHREVYCIAGNHDKTDAESPQSFLTPFSDMKHFSLIDRLDVCYADSKVFIVAAPYFKEEMFICDLENEKWIDVTAKGRKKVLFTHIAFNGSVNNDGTTIENSINKNLFKKFDLVLSGHYHNAQRVYDSVFHLPSICQNNFGEDETKGFTILYDDLSMDFHQADFKQYKTIVLTCDEFLRNKKGHFQQYADKCSLRIRITGSKEQLESIDTSDLKSAGIKVERVAQDIEYEHISEEIVRIDHKSMIDKFQEFCKREGLNVEEGIEFLKQIEQ
jgi:exonuclease SbcD